MHGQGPSGSDSKHSSHCAISVCATDGPAGLKLDQDGGTKRRGLSVLALQVPSSSFEQRKEYIPPLLTASALLLQDLRDIRVHIHRPRNPLLEQFQALGLA